VRWDSNRREPDNLRDAVRLARRAYSDEVPDKLHEGYDSIGEGGTPKMTDRAVGYIMGDPEGDDAARDPETGQRDLAGWHYSPFRANLSVMARGTETQRLYAAIVQSITIGGQDPRGSALSAGVRPRVHGEVGGAHGAARVPALDDGSETACNGRKWHERRKRVALHRGTESPDARRTGQDTGIRASVSGAPRCVGDSRGREDQYRTCDRGFHVSLPDR